MSKAQDILGKIKIQTQKKERLQMYNPQKRVLAFACGDGKHAVYVTSEEKLKNSKAAFKTRLTPKIVEKFLDGADNVRGDKLFKSILNIYKHYIWHKDERIYLFQWE